MSTRTPTPSRAKSASAGAFTRVLGRLAAAGWKVEITSYDVSERPRFALVARERGSEPDALAALGRATDAPVRMVIHGFGAADEVRLEDVWRVVAHRNERNATRAAILLPPGATVSALAAETAARTEVEIGALEWDDPRAPDPQSSETERQ